MPLPNNYVELGISANPNGNILTSVNLYFSNATELFGNCTFNLTINGVTLTNSNFTYIGNWVLQAETSIPFNVGYNNTVSLQLVYQGYSYLCDGCPSAIYMYNWGFSTSLLFYEEGGIPEVTTCYASQSRIENNKFIVMERCGINDHPTFKLIDLITLEETEVVFDAIFVPTNPIELIAPPYTPPPSSPPIPSPEPPSEPDPRECTCILCYHAPDGNCYCVATSGICDCINIPC